MSVSYAIALALVGWHLMATTSAGADETLKSCQVYAEVAKEVAVGRDRGDPLAEWIAALDKPVPDDNDGHIRRSVVQLVEKVYQSSASPDKTYDNVLGDCLQEATRTAGTR